MTLFCTVHQLLPACFPDTLECTVHVSKDITSLECLAWAVYDNLLVPRQSPHLSGFESYGQVVQHLVDKMHKGLHSWCLAHTSVVFESARKIKPIVTVLQKSLQAKGFPIMRDVREEFAKDQATGGQLDLIVDALKWMWE